MGDLRRISIPEFHAELKSQGVSSRDDIAFRCPICGTVQSMRSLLSAGAGKTIDDVEKFIGFSCVGRWNDAGPFKKKGPAAHGCDWTLGGLFRLHTLEVIDGDGKPHPHFEVATPGEAQALAASIAEAAHG